MIGLGTYAYFWQHAEGLSLAGAFEDTRAQGVDLFQICDYAPLLDMTDAQLREAAGVARDLGLTIELGTKGVEKREMGTAGGTIAFDGFSVTFTQAHHSSAQVTEDGVSHALGNVNGLMLHIEDEPSLLLMGDTDIFTDMGIINELHAPDIGIVPVGDRFTMGGAVAALACQRFFDFKHAIPCHYGTFGLLDQTPEKFVKGMEGMKTNIEAPKPGTVLSFD